MKTEITMNAFDLYYTLVSADTSFRADENFLDIDMSEKRIIIDRLKDQIESLNTTGNIKIIMKKEKNN